MPKPTQAQLAKRAEHLHAAAAAARLRVQGNPQMYPMRISVLRDTQLLMLVGKDEKSGANIVRLSHVGLAEFYDCYRVGSNPGDRYFELKLVPELGLALPCEYNGAVQEDSLRLSQLLGMPYSKPEIFVIVSPEDLVMTYDGNELRSIIKLLDSIK